MGLEIAATGLFAATTGIPQYFEQKKAGRRAQRAQEDANETSRSAAQVENARRRRQAIAQARMVQAQNQAAAGSAVQSASTLSGVQSSLTSQLGSNIGAQQQQIGAQRTIQGYQQSAANAIRRGQERTSLWDAGAQIGQMIGSFGLSSAGGLVNGAGGKGNMQGQATPLNNNTAFIKNY